MITFCHHGQLVRRGGIFLIVFLVLAGCQSEEDTPRQASEEITPQTKKIRVGRQKARVHCRSCHTLPRPSALDRTTWKEVVLPRMGHRFGVYDGPERPDSLIEEGEAGRLVDDANVFPKEPTISRETWEAIVAYYLQEAPAELPSPSNRPNLTIGLDTFQLHVPLFRQDRPLTTLVHAADSALYIGGAEGKTGGMLAILENKVASAFKEQSVLSISGPPSSMRIDGSTLYLTLMGHLDPTDAPSGRVVKTPVRPLDGGQRRYTTLFDDLQRPVHTVYADLTGNNREDVVVSEFGFRTGSLSWYEKVGEEAFERHVLRDVPGAIRSVVRDFTGNERPDVITLMAQGDEGVYLFRNEGNGQFEEERLIRFPPSFGSSSFELVDFDGDGALDILHTAGDNADYTPVMKPYHGIRIFLNDGGNNFGQEYFYPLNGAYGAVARDFDHDGDVDIAAISFFPNYENSRRESFVYLENKGNFEFDASTFRETTLGRWLVLESGDLDRDGDEDLILGSFSASALGSSYVPERLQEVWVRNGPSFVVLENTTL